MSTVALKDEDKTDGGYECPKLPPRFCLMSGCSLLHTAEQSMKDDLHALSFRSGPVAARWP